MAPVSGAEPLLVSHDFPEPETGSGFMSTLTEQKPVFPEAYFTRYQVNRYADTGQVYWVAAEKEAQISTAPIQSILLNNDILAYYGHPRSRNMGILGRYTKEELNDQLTILAEEYRVSGGKNVLKAFYIIYGTVWPGGDIGIIQESVLTEWVEYALENDIIIFIDHQIGRFTPADSLRRMLPWLRYPNVHLALDPEWRTTKPMLEIGMVTAEELNQVQRIMEDYMIDNSIPGERLLVVHQFHHRMIANREKVDSRFSKVRLVHCADGFGPPSMKRSAYAANAQAANIPVKGFKLFYESGMPGAGFDYPLMTPKEVMELTPRPYVVMYQ